MTGQTIGDYRITEKLGEGGFGVVYKAVELSLDREVALKTMDALLARDAKFRERFFAEARAQARLVHPNIVTIHRFFEHEGQYFIAMEYLEGMRQPDGTRLRTLADLVGRGPVPGEELLPLFRPVLDAVGYAHEHGVVHRDLKPVNVLFSGTGALKVADFGIAKLVSGETSVTLSGARVGTPAYMSPEQVLDKRLDRRTDIYSLGVMLYELATGNLPFKESDTSSFFEAHLQEPPPPPRQVNPAISGHLEQAILKAMAKKPEDRFQSCEEFAAAPAGGVMSDERSVKSAEADRGQPEEEGQLPGAGGQRTKPDPEVRRRAPEPAATEPVAVASRSPAGDRRPHSPTPFPPPQGGGREREGAWGERRAEGGRGKKAGWVAVAVVAAIAIVLLVAVTGGRNRGQPERARTQTGGEAVPAAADGVGATSQSRFVSRGRSAQGYEERLWLKDSSVMVKVPAGEFTMGSDASDANRDEKPVHRVYLDEYWIDKYEVTNRQYRKFCDATGRSHPPDPDFRGMSGYFTGYPDYPVVCVSWDDAKAYCDWAGKRLPTEAEWEKAARGTDGRKYPWGNSEPTGSRCNLADRNAEFSWSDKKADDGYARTAPVGSHPAGASPHGLLDMAGNVWEWCADWYGKGYYGRSASNNPQGPSTGSARVLRGGSWRGNARILCAANRFWFGPSYRFDDCGFRSAH
jgi:serine/threonine-protein kinase